ncbi:methylamine utilization protein MauE [Sphingomonas spermidinifaciens]|uniref:Methylamine utilization protein MauE n=1 Tax=Sphingomonas spermidinifaciens TaxID=1141889 RepID=A0A2A4B293_9SPHN|nr:MauE/DoxX family redox-associated membrane protein [Sphingomonas spermidinifaciens]PCD02085.1 methylamine utilization protein MauE [Sphingomonas spermidinifaciens]
MSVVMLLFDTGAAAVRVYAALMFVAAGLTKFHDRDGFAATVAAYRLLPAGAAAVIAAMLPPIELAIGAALVVPDLRIAAPAAAMLLALFALAAAINLMRGRRDLDCGCGTGARIGWGLVAGNLALSILLVATLGAGQPPLGLMAAAAALSFGLWLCARVRATLAALPPLRRQMA